MAPKIPTVTFKNGKTIPIVGLGTWKSQPGEVVEAVKNAIACGYRHIDCARCYENEPEVGEALAAKIADGTVKREDLFITTKLWLNSQRRELVLPAIRRSLKDLGLTYVDLYLVHYPVSLKEGPVLFSTDSDGKTEFGTGHFIDAWKGMEECHKLGLAKSIGISNFNKNQIERLLAVAEIPPVNNQIECHPYLSQKKLINFCREKGITVTAYSPLGSPDRPQNNGEPPLLDDVKVNEIAKKYNKSAGQILIKYHAQNGIIVVPKSVTKSRIESNIQIFDFEISDDDMETLESLNTNSRYLPFSFIKDHKEYPYNDEY